MLWFLMLFFPFVNHLRTCLLGEGRFEIIPVTRWPSLTCIPKHLPAMVRGGWAAAALPPWLAGRVRACPSIHVCTCVCVEVFVRVSVHVSACFRESPQESSSAGLTQKTWF